MERVVKYVRRKTEELLTTWRTEMRFGERQKASLELKLTGTFHMQKSRGTYWQSLKTEGSPPKLCERKWGTPDFNTAELNVCLKSCEVVGHTCSQWSEEKVYLVDEGVGWGKCLETSFKIQFLEWNVCVNRSEILLGNTRVVPHLDSVSSQDSLLQGIRKWAHCAT